VTDKPRHSEHEGQPPEVDIDTTVARPARVYSYLAGGDGHFAADRDAVEHVAEVLPEGVETARRSVDTMAAFLGRVVRYLAREVGVTQFLKLGTAVAKGKDIHEIAQDAAPATVVPRVVYVGSDPVVLAHAHSLRRGSPEGSVAYVHGTLRHPEAIIRQASETLDFDQPVAMLLPATLNFVPDESDPYGIVARLLAAVSPGSYLAIAHVADDPSRHRAPEGAERFSKMLGEPYVLRSAAEVARFFDGLDFVGPAVGAIDRWYPPGSAASAPPVEPGRPVPISGAVGRKP
jgi:S-adenosyl methyltransferase